MVSPTRPAVRWRSTLGAVALAAALPGAMLTTSPVATADGDAFLAALQPRFQFLESAELLSAGYRSCSLIRQGLPGSDVVAHLAQERGLGISVSAQIVGMSAIHLGC